MISFLKVRQVGGGKQIHTGGQSKPLTSSKLRLLYIISIENLYASICFSHDSMSVTQLSINIISHPTMHATTKWDRKKKV